MISVCNPELMEKSFHAPNYLYNNCSKICIKLNNAIAPIISHNFQIFTFSNKVIIHRSKCTSMKFSILFSNIGCHFHSSFFSHHCELDLNNVTML